MSVKCLKCGFIYNGHKNYFGKFCIKCDSYIPPTEKNLYIENLRNKFEINREIVRNYLKNKFKG